MTHRQNDAKDSLAMLAWFPRDWRSSRSRDVLSPLQRGLYRELLDAAWLDGTCSLPNEDKELAALAGCQLRVWQRVKGPILARFESGVDGRLRQSRLTYVWEHGVARRSARRKGAEETNAKRAAERDSANANRDGDRSGERDGKRTPASASPSASASNERNGSQPASTREEPPPTSGTPAEARTKALAVIGPKPAAGIYDTPEKRAAVVSFPDRFGQPGEAEAVRKELYEQLRLASEATKFPADVLLAKASRTTSGSVIVNPEGCTSIPWLQVTTDKLRGMRLSAVADAHQASAPTPKDERRRASMVAGITGGLKGDGTLPGGGGQ